MNFRCQFNWSLSFWDLKSDSSLNIREISQNARVQNDCIASRLALVRMELTVERPKHSPTSEREPRGERSLLNSFSAFVNRATLFCLPPFEVPEPGVCFCLRVLCVGPATLWLLSLRKAVPKCLRPPSTHTRGPQAFRLANPHSITELRSLSHQSFQLLNVL